MSGWENLLLVNPVTPQNLLQATKQNKKITVVSLVSLVQVLLHDIAGGFLRESLKFLISSTQQK